MLLRRAALALAAGLVVVPPPSLPATAATITGNGDTTTRQCITVSDSSKTVVTCRGFGLNKEGRVAGCAADEACIGTSALRSPSKYGPPWEPSSAAEATDVSRAWRSVVAAVEEEPDLKIADRDDGMLYLRAVGQATVPPDGTDDVEFRLTKDGGIRLLYRSATRQSVFLYPLQQPVANQESHAKRLLSIRRRLGWAEAGLPSDGAALASEMSDRYKVPTANRWFGLELGGMRVPLDDEYDD